MWERVSRIEIEIRKRTDPEVGMNSECSKNSQKAWVAGPH